MWALGTRAAAAAYFGHSLDSITSSEPLMCIGHGHEMDWWALGAIQYEFVVDSNMFPQQCWWF